MIKQTPIMAQYQAMKAQHPDCLLFFRLGDFYELLGEDAKIASSVLNIVLTTRYKNTPQEIPMCGIPVHACDAYLSRLIKKGFRVAVCDQVGDSKEKEEKTGVMRREVVRIVTPGTLMEDDLLKPFQHNFLLALCPGFKKNDLHLQKEAFWGVAFVDISTGDFFVESCADAALSSLLSRIHAREILFPQDWVDHPSIQALWCEYKELFHLLPPCHFGSGEKRLKSFFDVHTLESFGHFPPWEISAAGAILDYILLTQKKHLITLSRPKKIEAKHCVEVDAFTRRNLELVKSFSGERQGSLLWAMDMTVSAMGARLLNLRLNHPIKTLPQLEDRLTSVDFFVKHTKIRKGMREVLNHVLDLERALSRLMVGRFYPKDLGAIRCALIQMPLLLAFARMASEKEFSGELKNALSALQAQEGLREELEGALVEELPLSLGQGFVIAPGYNKELDAWRHAKEDHQALIEDLQTSYIDSTHISGLRIRHNSVLGYFVEVSAHSASKVPFDFTLKQSLTSCHRYTTPALMHLEQNIVSAQEKALEKETALVHALEQRIREAFSSLKAGIQALAVLDVSCALAEVACTYGYTRPVLDYSRTFHVVGGRHPIVERNEHTAFVKNSCILDQKAPIWILTGPNMSGKSTFLRQNALIALLAHIGSYVPADTAHIGLIDRIFTRVGASDDLARGLSTFMVEMVETAAILHQASEASLVILDEVGRGTSTFDGLSLAWASVEYMAQHLPCRTLFATHYHELSKMENVKNIAFYTLKINEWGQKVNFFYQVVSGISLKSYGIHVARLAGMPDSVVHRAEALLAQFEHISFEKASRLPLNGAE